MFNGDVLCVESEVVHLLLVLNLDTVKSFLNLLLGETLAKEKVLLLLFAATGNFLVFNKIHCLLNKFLQPLNSLFRVS